MDNSRWQLAAGRHFAAASPVSASVLSLSLLGVNGDRGWIGKTLSAISLGGSELAEWPWSESVQEARQRRRSKRRRHLSGKMRHGRSYYWVVYCDLAGHCSRPFQDSPTVILVAGQGRPLAHEVRDILHSKPLNSSYLGNWSPAFLFDSQRRGVDVV